MSKKRTRPTVGAAERAEQERVGTGAGSCSQDTMSASGSQALRVSDFLNIGEAGAIPMRHLRKMTHLDSRAIRQLIERERRAGVPICSNNRTGYYIAGSVQERDRFVRSMMGRSDEIRKTARAVSKAVVAS